MTACNVCQRPVPLREAVLVTSRNCILRVLCPDCAWRPSREVAAGASDADLFLVVGASAGSRGRALVAREP